MTPVPDELRRPRKGLRAEILNEEEPRANVIIVDDEESSRLVNSSLMRFLGFACDEASGGDELMDKLREQYYELILLDIMMPGVDGFEAARRIRNGDCGERNREACIIAVTACALEEDRERARKAGINAYLTKPLTIHALRETVGSFKSIAHHI